MDLARMMNISIVSSMIFQNRKAALMRLQFPLYLSFLFVVFSVTSCDKRKERINKQVNELCSNAINIPFSDMDTLCIDSTYISRKADFQILVYVDSTECTPCYANHYVGWEVILEECKDYNPSITLSVIIESEQISEEAKGAFLKSKFTKSIFIDKKGSFRKNNPTFPDSNIMHVLLLDKNNRVLLVGNPLNNEKVEELLYRELRKT